MEGGNWRDKHKIWGKNTNASEEETLPIFMFSDKLEGVEEQADELEGIVDDEEDDYEDIVEWWAGWEKES